MTNWILITIMCLILPSVAKAESCNLADVLFGPTTIEIIKNDGYERGIIFGANFNGQHFRSGKILGIIDAWGIGHSTSRSIKDVSGEMCGVLEKDLTIEVSRQDCPGCKKGQTRLKEITKNSYVVISQEKIVGTIDGRLPKY